MGLLGEGDVSPSTTDFPALRDASVFWQKERGVFTGLWLCRAGAASSTAPAERPDTHS